MIAIPTTTGSGSEATRFAVIYVHGTKYSLSHDLMLPTHVIIDPQLTLAMPQPIAAASSLDALSQAIESYWSINATHESKQYAKSAIRLITSHIRNSVLRPTPTSRRAMAQAANLAGKAINITKTTAPNALSYALTTHFHIAHGHAVALNLGRILEYNAQVTEHDCNDTRGVHYVKKTLAELIDLLGCTTPHEARRVVEGLIKDLGLKNNFSDLGIDPSFMDVMINKVNPDRLSGNPRKLTNKNTLRELLKA